MDSRPAVANTPQPASAFLRRLAEFENLVELSAALADQAELLERRYIGNREDGQPEQGGPAHIPNSLNDALELHAINLKITLERVSQALGRLTEESVGVPLAHQPEVDRPIRAEAPLQELGEGYKGPPY